MKKFDAKLKIIERVFFLKKSKRIRELNIRVRIRFVYFKNYQLENFQAKNLFLAY